MDAFYGMAQGLAGALQPDTLLSCFLGVLWGTLVGVLPGLGPAGGMAILMPYTSGMNFTNAMVMMAGIYYGSMYGGSTTSILAAIPGEVASAITVLDGYEMAKKGRAGAALSLSAIGSFVGGTIATLGLALLAPKLAALALDFGPPEYFTLALLGMSMAAYLSEASLAKGLSMAVVGLMISTVGMHMVSGQQRYTFGMMELFSGISVVPVIMGVYGISEVLEMVSSTSDPEIRHERLFDFRRLLPNRDETRRSIGPAIRGSMLGFFVGTLPGAGGTVSSFLSYAMEKRISKSPERFGHGAPEGIAGPETANNAGAQSSLIPLLTLGLPYNVVTAIMLSAMIVHGIFPSPLLVEREPVFFWTVVSSMYVGNVMLLILNLPLVGIWASLLRIPSRWLSVLILMFCLTGAYAVDFSSIDVIVMVAFGGIGLLMKRVGLPAAPMVLGLVLGPLLERALSQSLIMSKGNPLIFVTRPFSGTIFVILGLVLVSPLFLRLLRRKAEAGRKGGK
jgi:putative tricarboxylic transport membrane protein